MDKLNQDDQIVIYQSENGKVHVDVKFQDETVWLTQQQIADLFGVQQPAISKHFKNIFESGELEKESVYSILEYTASDGKVYNTGFYNLDAIISVGYRVNSIAATQFRRWATERLKEYVIKGFVLDDERLKNLGGGNYWKELLDRIRDIRSSEKVMYRQVLDLYATAVDYNPKSNVSISFFKMVQNKLHFATYGHTAAEVIYERADAEQPFMGLNTFKGDWPTWADAQIAKNYLTQEELKILNNLVSAYFDLAEINAMRRQSMTMNDHVTELNKILMATGEKLLLDSGRISHDDAMQKARQEYLKWQQNTLSPVEQAYIDTIKDLGSKAKNKK